MNLRTNDVARACALVVCVPLVLALPSSLRAGEAETAQFSLVLGCLRLPIDSQVVVTESRVDAFSGFIKLAGEERKLWWLTGLSIDLLEESPGRELIWVKAMGAPYLGLRYGVIREGGKRILVLSSGLVQFALIDGSEKDLDLLKNMMDSYEAGEACAAATKPREELGQRAF